MNPPAPSLAARIFARLADKGLALFEHKWSARALARWARPLKPHGQRRLDFTAAMHALQSLRLKRTVEHAVRHSPHYRSMFQQLGIPPASVRNAGDLGQLPFTTAADLEDSTRFLAVPRERIARIFETSGTTHKPIRVYCSWRDWRRMIYPTACALRVMRLREPLVCLIAHAQNLYIHAAPAQRIIEEAGGLGMTIGQPTPDRLVDSLQVYGPNAIMTSPSYLGALTRCAERRGIEHRFELILLDGEPLTQAQANRFTERWGGDVYNMYGLTEMRLVGFGHPGCDAIHILERQVLAEIVDPQSGKPAQKGELTLTSLAHEAMPLLRYRTGDVAEWSACRCGRRRAAIRLGGRLGDSLVVAATNLYGPRVSDEIAEIPGTTGSLEIIADLEDAGTRLTLRVGVDPDAAIGREDVVAALFRACPSLEADMAADAFRLHVERVPGMSLSPKRLRVRDSRA